MRFQRHSWPSGARTKEAKGSTRAQGLHCVWPALEERREAPAVGGPKRPRIGLGLGGRVEDGLSVIGIVAWMAAEDWSADGLLRYYHRAA
jgi:hypothetical protein